MSLKIRRVVTGHDANGRAIVAIDDVANNIKNNRPGASSCLIWTTDQSPANNDGNEDAGQRQIGTAVRGGTVFRIVRYEPGAAPRFHRTDSIDYIVVMSGELCMQLDDSEVLLKAGDVVVQRGTNHNWINRGPDVCVLAAVLIDAKPVTSDGKPLAAHG
jgi:quercetin dioxygenase-like cupin family protein